MKKRTWIIAIIVILAVIAAACIFGYLSGQNEPEQTEPPTTVEPDTTPETESESVTETSLDEYYE